MTKNENDNYISIDEAAEYLGIKTVTIRNWIKKWSQHTRLESCGNLSVPSWMNGSKVERAQLIRNEVKTTWTTIACQIFMLLLTPNIM